MKGEGAAADLVRVIRKVAQAKRRLSEIAKEAGQLQDSELFDLKEKVEQAATEGRDLLQEMAQDLDSRITASRDRLNSLGRN